MQDVEYPPSQSQEAKFASKHQCALCQRPLPFSPFSGIGWRDVSLDGTKQRRRICNECFVTWRKEHPPTHRETNVKLWNKIIMIGALILALYGVWSFLEMGITNWSRFLTGGGLIIIVGGLFLYIAHGIVNKRIEFIPPEKPKGKKAKFELDMPNYWKTQPIMRTQSSRQSSPKSLSYDEDIICDVCGLEKEREEVFTHPDGFKICNDCIARKRHYGTNNSGG